MDSSKILPIRFCPVCAKALNSRQTIDPLIAGYVCEQKHRSFVPRQLTSSPKIFQNGLKLRVAATEPLKVMHIWLTDTKYRSKLHDNAAEITRIIYEKASGTYGEDHQPKGVNPYRYCPICSEELASYPHNFIMDYRHRYKCPNDHVFYTRSELTYYDKNGDYALWRLEPSPGDIRNFLYPVTYSREPMNNEERRAFLGQFYPAQLIDAAEAVLKETLI